MSELLSATIGRITVCFIPDEPCSGTIRVVLNETGEVLRNDRVEHMTDEEWQEIVAKYKRMMEIH